MADQKREIWVHRISHHYTVAKPLLDEQGILTIGYADLNDPRSDFLKKNQFKDFSSFNAFIKTTKYYNASRFSLHRFLALFKPGDLIVVPDLEAFSIYEVVEKANTIRGCAIEPFKALSGQDVTIGKADRNLYTHEGTKLVDLGFGVKVKPVNVTALTGRTRDCIDLPVSDFADELLAAALKIKSINGDITHLTKSVENAIRIYKN